MLEKSLKQCPRLIILTFIYRLELDDEELLSMQQLCKHAHNQQIALVVKESFVGDLRLDKLLAGLDTEIPIQVVSLRDEQLGSIAAYNQLLMSSWFYRLFLDYEYLLVYQLDCILVRKGLEHWLGMGYSYVGAPWFGKLKGFSYFHQFVGVGNGGLSLRSIHDAIYVLENVSLYKQHIFSFSEITGRPRTGILSKIPIWSFLSRHLMAALSMIGYHNTIGYFVNYKKAGMNEDIFWSVVVPRVAPWFQTPSPRVASRFALETNHKEAREFYRFSKPLGYHAWKKYGLTQRDLEND